MVRDSAKSTTARMPAAPQALLDPRCRVEMLGTLRLVRADLPEPVTRFALKRAGALLAYLALYPNLQPRERLIDIFWPEMDPKAARANLSTTLASLRRQIEPPGIGHGDVLISDHTQIGLNFAAVTTDVVDFERLLDRAAAADAPSARADLLQQAVALYQGDFLPGFYYDWSINSTVRLQSRFTEALKRLRDDLEALGSPAAALETAQRLVAADAYSEDAQIRLVRLLVLTDRVREARETYQKVSSLFEKEFGAPFSAATRRTFEEVLALAPDRGGLRPVGVVAPAESAHVANPTARAASERHMPTVTEPLETGPPLPVILSRFFGRELELEQLARHLLPRKGIPDGPELPERPSRLVTLIGFGGNGKTRLALEFLHQASEQFGLWCGFVSLADLLSPVHIPDRIASALRIPIVPKPDVSSLEQVATFLAQVERSGRATPAAILVLDNLEHLLAQETDRAFDAQAFAEAGETVRILNYLLQQAPGLAILCTSRQRLGLRGERLIPVGPLPMPEAFAAIPDESALLEILQAPSVRLYLDRARSARPDFALTANNAPAVVALCRLLDGSALAIELAATWVRMLPPRKMWERLSQGLDIPVGSFSDLPARHRSLNAAVEWSYRLLSSQAQRLFARLAVFQGGWTIASATVVAGDEDEYQTLALLSALQDASLISVSEPEGEHRKTDEDEMRYRFLETVCAYARKRLEEQEDWKAVERRYTIHFLEFAETTSPKLSGPDQATWLWRLEAEHDNLRAGLTLFLAGSGRNDVREDIQTDLELAIRITTALTRFWQMRGHWSEGKRRVDEVLARTEGRVVPLALRGKILHAAGGFANMHGDFGYGQELLEASLAIRRELGDRTGIADILHNLGHLALQQGAYPRARPRYEEALAICRELNDPIRVADELHHLGWLVHDQGQLAQARALYEESLATRRPLGDLRGIANTLQNLGNIDLAEGKTVSSRALYEECLAIRRELGDRKGLGAAYVCLANLMSAIEDCDQARAMYLQALAINEEISNLSGLLDTLYCLAHVEFMQQRYLRAVQIYGAAEAQRAAKGYGVPADAEQFQELLASARAALGSAAVEQAWAGGQRMTWQEVVAFARE